LCGSLLAGRTIADVIMNTACMTVGIAGLVKNVPYHDRLLL